MKPADEFVVLVDQANVEIGRMEKLEAHRTGRMHRAFSVFVLDSRGRILLQRRAAPKYHSAGLWSNSCCGHPRPQEHFRDAAKRRLREEMGITCELEAVDRFLYYAPVEGGLVEHELDHVLVGRSDALPVPDSHEVSEFKWIESGVSSEWLRARPETFTAWFPQAFAILLRETEADGG